MCEIHKYISTDTISTMKKSEKYEKKIMKLSMTLFDPSIDPEEKERLKKEFTELNRKKSIAIQQELNEELEPKKVGILQKLANIPEILSERVHSRVDAATDNMFQKIDSAHYDILESEIRALLDKPNPKSKIIHDYILENYGSFENFFGCQGPTKLEEYIDLNLEKDFHLITGSEPTQELKDVMRVLFTEHRDIVNEVIQETIELQKEEMWANIGDIRSERIIELVRMELSDIDGEDRVNKLAEVYCRFIKGRNDIDGDNSPENIETTYSDISVSFYRNLKLEMNNQGIWDKKQYVSLMEFDDADVMAVWQVVKEKILGEMEYDSYLG